MRSNLIRRELKAIRSASLLALLAVTGLALALALVLTLAELVDAAIIVLVASTLIAVVLNGVMQHRRDTLAASRVHSLSTALTRMKDEFRRLDEQAGLLRARAIELRSDVNAIGTASDIDAFRSDIYALGERIDLQAQRRQKAMQRRIEEITRDLGTKQQLDEIAKEIEHVIGQIGSPERDTDGLASAEDIELLLAQLLTVARRDDG
ncbi:hypothetical protein M3G50_01065 [Brachybacterium muris]|uniref:hypothetical protein n=1 Tax=Brachybacterium muris TaxID=219301 RepID=UPI0021A6B44D|nr:hypothetical protein [Brachybacterium muris]MCT1429359.1 hypothetical protein [Brachybacterium muris]